MKLEKVKKYFTSPAFKTKNRNSVKIFRKKMEDLDCNDKWEFLDTLDKFLDIPDWKEAQDKIQKYFSWKFL